MLSKGITWEANLKSPFLGLFPRNDDTVKPDVEPRESWWSVHSVLKTKALWALHSIPSFPFCSMLALWPQLVTLPLWASFSLSGKWNSNSTLQSPLGRLERARCWVQGLGAVHSRNGSCYCSLPSLSPSTFLLLPLWLVCLPSSYNDCFMNTFFSLIQKQTSSDVAINLTLPKSPWHWGSAVCGGSCELWAVICLGRLIKSLGLVLVKSLWSQYTIVTLRFAQHADWNMTLPSLHVEIQATI